jgi:hypothetical protein
MLATGQACSVVAFATIAHDQPLHFAGLNFTLAEPPSMKQLDGAVLLDKDGATFYEGADAERWQSWCTDVRQRQR